MRFSEKKFPLVLLIAAFASVVVLVLLFSMVAMNQKAVLSTNVEKSPVSEQILLSTNEEVNVETASTTWLMLEKVKSELPGNLEQAIQLSPGRVIAVLSKIGSDDRSHQAAWFLDLGASSFQKLTEEFLTAENRIHLAVWEGGAVIQVAVFPGEAIGSLERIYVDGSGKILTRTKTENVD